MFALQQIEGSVRARGLCKTARKHNVCSIVIICAPFGPVCSFAWFLALLCWLWPTSWDAACPSSVKPGLMERPRLPRPPSALGISSHWPCFQLRSFATSVPRTRFSPLHRCVLRTTVQTKITGKNITGKHIMENFDFKKKLIMGNFKAWGNMVFCCCFFGKKKATQIFKKWSKWTSGVVVMIAPFETNPKSRQS